MTIDDRHSHRAGGSLDDLCRACGMVRRHTVIVAAIDAKPARVICDYLAGMTDRMANQDYERLFFP